MSAATTHRFGLRYSHPPERYTLRGLLQGMRTECHKGRRDGILCLPTGHPDYVEMFEASRVKLNVGSMERSRPMAGGVTNAVVSRPLSMFHPGAVEVDSEGCIVLQAANLLAHAVLVHIQGELGWPPAHLRGSGIEAAYGRLPGLI